MKKLLSLWLLTYFVAALPNNGTEEQLNQSQIQSILQQLIIQQDPAELEEALQDERVPPLVNTMFHTGQTPLTVACEYANPTIVKLLIMYGADPLAKDFHNTNVLSVSAAHNQQQHLQTMIDLYGTEIINTQNVIGDKTLLMDACEYNRLEIIQFLLQHHADVNLQSSYDEKTALMFATEKEHIQAMQLLITHGANINLKNKRQYTALMIAVINKKTEAAKLLLQHHADTNITDHAQQTALMHAAENGNKEITNLLLKSPDIKIEQQDTEGKTALLIAAEYERYAALQLLLQAGAHVDKQDASGCTALFFASKNGDMKSLQSLIKYKANVNLANYEDESPLLIASEENFDVVVKILLQYKANPNTQNDDGETALIVAAHNNNHKIIHYLLHFNADPNIQDNTGSTPLITLAENDIKEFDLTRSTKLLLQHPKIKINLKDNNNQTAFEIAKSQGNTTVSALIALHMTFHVLSLVKETTAQSLSEPKPEEFTFPAIVDQTEISNLLHLSDQDLETRAEMQGVPYTDFEQELELYWKYRTQQAYLECLEGDCTPLKKLLFDDIYKQRPGLMIMIESFFKKSQDFYSIVRAISKTTDEQTVAQTIIQTSNAYKNK